MKRLIGWEWKKLLQNQKIMWFILAAILIEIWISIAARPRLYVTYNLDVYRDYIAEYGGIYHGEIREEISDKLQEYAAQREANQSIIAGYEISGVGSYEEYEAAQLAMVDIGISEQALHAVYEKTEYLDSIVGACPVLAYELELSAYLKRFKYNLLLNVFCLVFSVILFYENSMTGMYQLLTPSYTGRKRIQAAKWILAVSGAFIATFILYGLNFLIMMKRWEFCNLNIPAVSLEYFKGWKSTIILYEALGILLVFREIQSVLSIAVVGMCARICKSVTVAVVLFGVLTIILYLAM